jgi:hypothetical protein
MSLLLIRQLSALVGEPDFDALNEWINESLFVPVQATEQLKPVTGAPTKPGKRKRHVKAAERRLVGGKFGLVLGCNYDPYKPHTHTAAAAAASHVFPALFFLFGQLVEQPQKTDRTPFVDVSLLSGPSLVRLLDGTGGQEAGLLEVGAGSDAMLCMSSCNWRADALPFVLVRYCTLGFVHEMVTTTKARQMPEER